MNSHLIEALTWQDLRADIYGESLTTDRDFGLFPELRTGTPL